VNTLGRGRASRRKSVIAATRVRRRIGEGKATGVGKADVVG
jgi:hypothetical protein